MYILSNGTHTLSSPIATFQNIKYISFIGTGEDTVIQCTADETGLSFESVTNLHFSSFKLLGCSAWRNSSSKAYSNDQKLSFVEILVALYIYSCENFTMDHISVSHSPNATGVVVYNTVGTNIIRNSMFSNNIVPSDTEHGGGGGFYVEFTFCIPGHKNCSDGNDSYTNQNHDSTYIFESCLFENNTALSSDLNSAKFLVPYRSNHFAIGRGGGLSIFMKANATRNHIRISNCYFIGNSATWGGGLFVEFHDNTSNNVVTIGNATLAMNHCPFTNNTGTGGGGMRLGHYVFDGSTATISNRIIIIECNFINNTAFNGGGLSISPTVQNVDQHQVATVHINQSYFGNNIARLGAALHVSRFAMIIDGNVINVALSDCIFDANSNDFITYLHSQDQTTTNAYQPGLGAVYINQVPVSFQKTVIFTGNNGSALVAVGASVDYRNCSAYFSLNQGLNGGAIALLGLAWLRINDNTIMYFSGNVAILNGGAIYNKYIEKENLVTYVNCFIRHTNYYTTGPENWASIFYFFSNFDQSGSRPSAIYSTSILPCAWAGGSLVSEDLLDKIFCWNDNWVYSSNPCSSYIHSDIGNVKFTNVSNIAKAFPGKTFSLPLHISDDLHKISDNQTVFSRSLNGYHNNTTPSMHYIWELETKVSGNVSSTSSLFLDSIGDRMWHIAIEVELEECPPGFKFNKNTLECKCLSGGYSGAVSCDSDMENAYLKNENWMGKIEGHDEYFVANCPVQYCFSNESASLPNSTDKLDTELCGKYNRTGTLCGDCINGFAVAVNSLIYMCINCTDENLTTNRLKYIAAVYIPLALLFSSIILLNIRLTSAPANAFILFCQVLASTFDLNADGQIPVSKFAEQSGQTFVRAYKIMYGIFNLDFIEQFLSPLCVGNMTALDVIALDYAVAFSPLVMIIVILILYRIKQCFRSSCCRVSGRIRRLITKIQSHKHSIGEAILPAFAAFFLLSYNKFCMTSSLLTNSQLLVLDNGEPASPINDSLRVYFAGSYSFYDPQYRTLYLIPASIVFATFVAIPPILLLDFPIKALEMCLIKVPFLWRKYPVGKVHILLDTFQGCFKNKMRFFAGLYFLFRLAINITYNMTDNWGVQYLIQQLLCSLMVGLLLICQPYNKENKLFNFVDPLIFSNLGILNAISFFLLFVTKTKQVPGNKIFVLQCVLVLLPLVFMMLYIIYYFFKRYKKHLRSRLKEFLKQGDVSYQPLRGVASVTVSVVDTQDADTSSNDEAHISDDATEEEALFQRAKSINTYRPPSRTEVGINGRTVSGPVTASTDSGLRLTRSTSSNNYGSTEGSIPSLKNKGD